MWRSLVAHVVRDDGVAGSNPVIPTKMGRFLFEDPPSFISSIYGLVPGYVAKRVDAAGRVTLCLPGYVAKRVDAAGRVTLCLPSRGVARALL